MLRQSRAGNGDILAKSRQHMFWQLFQTYPWGVITTVVLPIITGLVAIIGGIVWSGAGYENLKHQFTEDERARRIEETVTAIHEDKTDIQGALKLFEFYDNRLAEAGKRDAVLVALINQYQQLSRAIELFGQMSQGDSLQEKGKISTEILKILNQDVVRTLVRDDLPGKPLLIEVAPNSFRVIFNVPMRIPPTLTFLGLPEGVTASVSDKSEISFTVSFLPLSIPIHSFGFTASADL
jgi:hypothetical protein